MKNGVCPKCGCTVVIQGAQVRGHKDSPEDLSVAVYANPTARWFRGEATGDLWACVCGACGFTELYATNLDELVKAAEQAQPKGEGS